MRSIAQEKLKEINGAYEVIKASFFDTSIAPSQTTTGESEVAADSPAADSDRRFGRGTAFWTVSGIVALAVVVVAVFLVTNKKRDAFPASTGAASPGKSRYALVCNPGGRVEISTTGSWTGTFTIECWTSTRRPKGTGTILSSRGLRDFSFDIKFREGKRIHGDIGDGTRWLMKMANARFNYNRDIWYHIAYVVTPTNYSIYVNGALTDDGQIYPPGKPMLYDAEHRLCLGADVLEPADLDGSIAEVRIWKTARTAEQIKEKMNVSLAGNESGLHSYWRFDEGYGTKTKDTSGHGFTATLIGNVDWTTNVPPVGSR